MRDAASTRNPAILAGPEFVWGWVSGAQGQRARVQGMLLSLPVFPTTLPVLVPPVFLCVPGDR